jgi:hypothetical protein
MPQVRLLPSFWKDTMELNRSYLYSLPNERLAHNFRVNAGIPSDADPLGGWEAPDCELRGHYVGHYLSACALMHASTGDEVIASKASALVGMLAECQAKDGYLSAFPTEFFERLRKHQAVWAPFYTYHKIMAGLIDMHQHTGNQLALQMAERMADWAARYSASFTDEDWQKVLLEEQGGMNDYRQFKIPRSRIPLRAPPDFRSARGQRRQARRQPCQYQYSQSHWCYSRL